MPKRGFTLVEIMVVVAIIAILALIAIPSFIRSRINANELAAVTSCRTINNASQAYYMDRNPHEYPNTLTALAKPVTNPPYIDDVLALGTKQGYNFNYARTSEESFTLHVSPTAPGRTGIRYFFVDETGLIRANSNDPADKNSPTVE